MTSQPLLSFQKDVLRSDLVVCSAAAVLSFAVSASTVFLSLRVGVPRTLVSLSGPFVEVTYGTRAQKGRGARKEG